MTTNELKIGMERYCKAHFGRKLEDAKLFQVWNCLSAVLLEYIVDDWEESKETYEQQKQAYYISAEYLMGRALGNNLINLGKYDEVKKLLEEMNFNLNEVEEIEEDKGLGNGGLGRLAACFLDSGATMHLPLMGYGIRYSNGLFEQKIVNESQHETADTWLRYGDPFSIRKDHHTVLVKFDDYVVRAVPHDTPIISYKSKNINTLRLWKCEALSEFDFHMFNSQRYDDAVRMRNRAEDISRVLYPNDTNEEGKLLRLRQQYFLVSASIQDVVRKYKLSHGDNFDKFHEFHTFQLNDTHPVLGIPEFVRILMDEEGYSLEDAVKIAGKSFAYTNHTILSEALEKWDIYLINKIFRRIGEIIYQLDNYFLGSLEAKGIHGHDLWKLHIVQGTTVHMANLAIHCSKAVNGVAALHTEILKNSELRDWYNVYPEKFQNKTNGITPRRWLRSCNKELSELLTELLGNEDWVTDLSKLKELEKFIDDDNVLNRIMDVKHIKKQQLCDFVLKTQDIKLNPDSIFDIQIKRLHEYKRQLLNALYIMDLYLTLKQNPEKEMPPVTFIFGAKAFPGYRRAKSIIKFICKMQTLINNDPVVNKKINVLFVENYRVSVAEKLFPAADISKQISMAGKEASGTGNMKFMLNGAPTFGTYDGANVEIVEESGEENNFIFGLRVEDIEELRNHYHPHGLYDEHSDIRRAVNSLVDGTVNDGGTGEFKELHDSLINWQFSDEYFVLADFKAFKEAQEEVFKAYADKRRFAKMCLMNIANAGAFSSDRTIMQYANEIWDIKPVEVK